VHPTDDPGPSAGAGISPTDPGAPGDGDKASGQAVAVDEELVSAVEDLVRDLMPDGDAPRG
jgi:hypothetical protein